MSTIKKMVMKDTFCLLNPGMKSPEVWHEFQIWLEKLPWYDDRPKPSASSKTTFHFTKNL